MTTIWNCKILPFNVVAPYKIVNHKFAWLALSMIWNLSMFNHIFVHKKNPTSTTYLRDIKVYIIDKIFAFWAANSSSLKIPFSFRDASFSSSAVISFWTREEDSDDDEKFDAEEKCIPASSRSLLCSSSSTEYPSSIFFLIKFWKKSFGQI